MQVMMKDLADSRRLLQTIKAMPEGVRSPVRYRQTGPALSVGPVSATIISAHFWPPLQTEPLVLDAQV